MALAGVSFDVAEGEMVGVIGKNGAGKSTLLKIMSRLTSPTHGQIKLKGRLASMLEVGTGFHPELTGRENVFLNGAILGLTKSEIGKKFDQIASFSEIESFLDTPVKRYSSGMFVRLAFAVAAHLEPDIMLVDEVLAVGDAQFQNKCLGKMRQVGGEGRTVLFVSHNMGVISNLCPRSILMHQGRIIADGPTSEIIDRYMTMVSVTNEAKVTFPIDPALPAQIVSANLESSTGERRAKAAFQDDLIFRIGLDVRKRSDDYNTIIAVRNSSNVIVVFSTDRDLEEAPVGRVSGRYDYTVSIPRKLLGPGSYFVRFMLIERKTGTRLGGSVLSDNEDNLLTFTITDTQSKRARENLYGNSAVAPELPWRLEEVA